MQFLVVFACALAAASAQYGSPYGGGYQQQGPSISNGVPVETPEVQQAKASHFAAVAEAQASARSSGPSNYNDGSYNPAPAHYAAPAQAHYGAQAQSHYSAPAPAHYGIPAQGQYSAPAQSHYGAQPQSQYAGPAQAPSHYSAPAQSAGQYQGNNKVDPAYATTYGNAQITSDGRGLLETPEVIAAKSNHFALVSEALARATPQGPAQYGGEANYDNAHYRKRRGIYAYDQHVPVIHNGVPVETPEVQHAKAAHFAAHAAAGGYAHPQVYANEGYAHAGYAHAYAPAVYAGHYNGFQGLSADGLPLDTPEVNHAKAAHFAAFNEAAARNGVAGHYGYAAPFAHYEGHHNGAPVDTPEVQHAKAAHFAAHAAARSGHY